MTLHESYFNSSGQPIGERNVMLGQSRDVTVPAVGVLVIFPKIDRATVAILPADDRATYIGIHPDTGQDLVFLSSENKVLAGSQIDAAGLRVKVSIPGVSETFLTTKPNPVPTRRPSTGPIGTV